MLESGLKSRLLHSATTGMLFSAAGVDTHVIAWNRVVLLHGPPGTGKTSLCKALAQKLAVRLNHKFPLAQLLEINAHSLFSKWFSESGKLVQRLFDHIGELLDDADTLVFVLIGACVPHSPSPAPWHAPPAPQTRWSPSLRRALRLPAAASPLTPCGW